MKRIIPFLFSLVVMSMTHGQIPIAPGAELTLVADGCKFTEGPAVDARGNVYFTDQPNNRIHKWSTDGKLSVFHDKPGRSNGLYFDKKGNLYVGNFGDGTLHKITFDAVGEVDSTSIFAKSECMRTTDGICIDDDGNIYVADFSENAVCKVSPDGEVTVIARSGDCDGSKGGLDQPGEPIVWGDKLVVTCFDKVTGPDKVNTGHDKPYTIAYIDMDAIK